MAFVEGKRKWQPREMAMVAEYVQKFYPGEHTITRVRLGAPHPDLLFDNIEPAEINLLKVYSRWADALVIKRDRVILIEAKIRPRLGPLEGLELYARLFKGDPEYAQYHKLPLEKHFVYAIEDPVLNAMARERGIRTIQYRPDWLGDYVDILQGRESRAPLTETGGL